MGQWPSLGGRRRPSRWPSKETTDRVGGGGSVVESKRRKGRESGGDEDDEDGGEGEDDEEKTVEGRPRQGSREVRLSIAVEPFCSIGVVA